MSNLGMYQTMVTIAKRVGGPWPFMGLLVGGGVALGIAVDKAASLAASQKRQRRVDRPTTARKETVYVVESRAESGSDLVLEEGDKFKVLEADGDAVLIEVIGIDNNPYVVSGELLASASNYSF